MFGVGRDLCGSSSPMPLPRTGEKQWPWARTSPKLCPEPPVPGSASNICSKEHCSPKLVFSPPHTPNSPLSPQMGCGALGKCRYKILEVMLIQQLTKRVSLLKFNPKLLELWMIPNLQDFHGRKPGLSRGILFSLCLETRSSQALADRHLLP